MFHFHKWSKWSTASKTDILNRCTGGVIGYAFVQSRTCSKCGLTEYSQQQVLAN